MPAKMELTSEGKWIGTNMPPGLMKHVSVLGNCFKHFPFVHYLEQIIFVEGCFGWEFGL